MAGTSGKEPVLEAMAALMPINSPLARLRSTAVAAATASVCMNDSMEVFPPKIFKLGSGTDNARCNGRMRL